MPWIKSDGHYCLSRKDMEEFLNSSVAWCCLLSGAKIRQIIHSSVFRPEISPRYFGFHPANRTLIPEIGCSSLLFVHLVLIFLFCIPFNKKASMKYSDRFAVLNSVFTPGGDICLPEAKIDVKYFSFKSNGFDAGLFFAVLSAPKYSSAECVNWLLNKIYKQLDL